MKTALGLVLTLCLVFALGCSGGSKHKAAGSATANGDPAAGSPVAPVVETTPSTAGADPSAGKPPNYDQDKAVLQKQVQDNPTNVLALYNMGLLLQTGGDKAGAESAYRRALLIDINFAPALYNLGSMRYAAAGGQQEAVELLRRFVSINPDDANGHFNLGLALGAVGLKDEAAAETAKSDQLRNSQAALPPPPAAPAPSGPR